MEITNFEILPDCDNKFYLGDAVYVGFDGFHVVLVTSDGTRETNRICLDPLVVAQFLNWLERLAQVPEAKLQTEKD